MDGIWKDVALFTIKTLIVILLAAISFSVRSVIMDIQEVNDKTIVLFQNKVDKKEIRREIDMMWKEINKLKEK